MIIDLSKEQLFAKEIVRAARKHGQFLNMETKRCLDRESSHFKNHAVKLSRKIDDSYTRNKDLVFVAEGENNVNDVVVIFSGELYTTMNQLESQVKKRLSMIKEFVRADPKEEINFNFLAATSNLDVSKGKTCNKIVAVAQFVSSIPVRNFCCTL